MNLQKIKHLMKVKGMTNQELIKKSKVPEGTLYKILNGTTTNPGFNTVKSIANALNLTTDEFLDLIDYQPVDHFPYDPDKVLERYNMLTIEGQDLVNTVIDKELERMALIPHELLMSYLDKYSPDMSEEEYNDYFEYLKKLFETKKYSIRFYRNLREFFKNEVKDIKANRDNDNSKSERDAEKNSDLKINTEDDDYLIAAHGSEGMDDDELEIVKQDAQHLKDLFDNDKV